jgi:hypothetical protein
MVLAIFGAVLIAVVIGRYIAKVHRFLSLHVFSTPAWRFLTGGEPGRQHRGRRMARRWGVITGLTMTLALWMRYPHAMTRVILAALAVGMVLGCWLAVRWARQWNHYRKWLRPVHWAAHEVAQIDQRRHPRSWLEIAPDRSRVVAALPPGWPADDKDKQRLVAIITAKTGIESPDASWRLAGPKPQLALTAAQPPPARVTLADIREAIDRAKADEVVWGLGRSAAVVKTSLSGDSPHGGLSMGSGAGKSIAARSFLAQMLYKGCLGIVLDYKMISHQWAKGLPNVVIYRRPQEIHEALCWLGGDPTRDIEGEANRRNEVAEVGSDLEGNVHAVVGDRIIVICEELNATMSKLRAHWRLLRNEDKSLPQRSPALEALDAVNLMGRQVLINLLYMGQRLSVKAIGGDGDARESIGVIAFGRYSASNWKMLAPDFAMPPQSRAPGRIQVVTDQVRECQAVFMTAKEARELALAGTVATPPAGMPYARAVATETPAPISGPEQGFVSKTGTDVLAPPAAVTLSEAVAQGVVSCSLHAVRKASQRDPEFPGGVDVRGLAKLYDATELALWDASRR